MLMLLVTGQQTLGVAGGRHQRLFVVLQFGSGGVARHSRHFSRFLSVFSKMYKKNFVEPNLSFIFMSNSTQF